MFSCFNVLVFIIIPAYNEEKNIGRVVSGLFEHGLRQIIVVDDGSTDNTNGKAKEAGAVVLRHEINRGQGAALQTGHEYAFKNGADAVVDFDGDGQFNPADIAPAAEAMSRAEADAAFGSRFLDKRSKIP